MSSIFTKITNGRGLAARVFRGGALLGAASGAEQAFRFVRNMFLTRLLAPEAFGMMAIVLSVNALFQVLTSIGVKEAIIQNPRGTERTYLNGAWWLSLARSTLLFFVALAAAPFISSFYEKPDLTLIVRVAFLNVLFQGALSPGAYVAVKQMRYIRWVLIQQAGGIVGVCVAVSLAFFVKGVWALVAGYVTEAVARCVLSFLIAPFRPGLDLEKGDLRSLVRYSRGIFGLPALLLVYTEGPTFVVGKLCTTRELGLYAMTLTLARVASMVVGMMGDLLLPAFAEMQQDALRINRTLLKVLSLIALAAIPAMAFVTLFAEPLLSLVYGPEYGVAALPLLLLLANEMLVASNIPMASVYLALGQPTLLRRFSVLRAVLVIVVIYPAVRYFGLVGAAATPLLAAIASYGVQLVRLKVLTGLVPRQILEIPLRCLPGVLPLAVVWLVVHAAFPLLSATAGMIAVGIASALVYGLVGVAALRYRAIRALFCPPAAVARVV